MQANSLPFAADDPGEDAVGGQETGRPKRTLWSIFTLIELIAIGILFAALILPMPFGFQPFVVKTNSMAPTVPQGSFAVINQNITADDIGVGDIVEYSPALGTLVMHRIDAIQGDGYIFKGDNNDSRDLGTVSSGQIRGKYLFHIPDLGLAIDAVLGCKFQLLIGLVVLNIAIYALARILSRRRGRDEREGGVCHDDAVTSIPAAQARQL